MTERVSISAADNLPPPLFLYPALQGVEQDELWQNDLAASYALGRLQPPPASRSSDFSSLPNWIVVARDSTAQHPNNSSRSVKSDLENFSLPFTEKEAEKKLFALFESEPFEDGYSHPAEQLIEDLCRKYKMKTGILLQGIYLKNLKRPAFAASLLRCLGRLKHERVAPWGMVLVIAGLAHAEAEVREAAVRVLETWGGGEALGVLRIYSEMETIPWLKRYIEQVIKDLSD